MFHLNEARTLPCPACGAILFETDGRCNQCGVALDARETAASAEERERFLNAVSDASSVLITAKAFPVIFGLSFVPMIGIVGIFGVPMLLAWVPIATFQWYRRYGAFKYPDPELPKARRSTRLAAGIWFLALLVAPVWYFVRFP